MKNHDWMVVSVLLYNIINTVCSFRSLVKTQKFYFKTTLWMPGYNSGINAFEHWTLKELNRHA